MRILKIIISNIKDVKENAPARQHLCSLSSTTNSICSSFARFAARCSSSKNKWNHTTTFRAKRTQVMFSMNAECVLARVLCVRAPMCACVCAFNIHAEVHMSSPGTKKNVSDPTDLQECRLLVKLCLGSCAPVAFPLVPNCSCSGSKCMSTRNHCKTMKGCGGQPFKCFNRRRLECKRRKYRRSSESAE